MCLVLAACNGSGVMGGLPEMEVEVVNYSSRDLLNAYARFGEYRCGWGIVGNSFSKSYLFFPHPITPDAELHWDEDGRHRMEKIDLRKIYPPGKSGRLTFTVHDGRVEVGFREKAPAP
jgi:hypothetical protein